MSERDVVVEVTSLVKRFGDVTAVAELDFSIRRGEVFGLLGPNGAGKTTTIECLVGLRRPTSGRVRVFGLDPVVDRSEITAAVAVQPQSAILFDTLTVRETLELFASFHASPRPVSEVMDDVGLAEQAKVRSRRLSGGQQRRLLLAVALVADPRILVLDEPSAGLDPAARQALWRIIGGLRERGTTIVLSTHNMDEATTVCDRVAIVVAGRLAALDSPEELIRQRTSAAEVSFTVTGPVSEQEIGEVLFDLDFESESVRGGRRIRARTDDPDELIRRITFRTSLRARDLSVRQRTLEDIFLELTEPSDIRTGDTTSVELD